MWQLAALLLGALTCHCLGQSGSHINQEPLRPESRLKHLIKTDELVEFHKNLTQKESITYNEKEVGEWLAGSLESQGYHVEKQYVDEEAGRFNVFAYPGETRDAKVLVSSHIDTV